MIGSLELAFGAQGVAHVYRELNWPVLYGVYRIASA